MTYSKQDFLNDAQPLAENLLTYAMQAGAAYGVTDARINISASEKIDNEVEGGEVVHSVSGLSYGVGITLYAGDRVLSFFQNTLGEKALKEAMLQNMQVIALAPPNPDKRLLEKDMVFNGEAQDLDLIDNNPPSQDMLIEYARKIEAGALAQPGINKIESVSSAQETMHLLSLATNGLKIVESTTGYSAGAVVIAENESGMQNGGDYVSACHFSDLGDPEEIGCNAALEALEKLDAIIPVTTEMTIVLSQEAAESFFDAVYDAIDGSALIDGLTFMKDKLGKQVMSKSITLVDDPTILRGHGSGQIDSAGQEMKKITFIEKGVLKSFNVNLKEARELGMPPIGRNNGPTNSTILPGTQSPDELMADIKEGIYIKDFMGGTMDVNNGDFSCPASGLLIENGKITTKAVDGFIVSGDLKKMFMRVSVANDTPSLPDPRHSFAVPTTRIDKVMIAGK